jgi:hypothetical protein
MPLLRPCETRCATYDVIPSIRYAITMRRSARQMPTVERFKPKPKRSGWIGGGPEAGEEPLADAADELAEGFR